MIIWKKEFETGFFEIDSSNRLIVFEINEFCDRNFDELKKGEITSKFDQLIRIIGIKFNIETLFYRDKKLNEIEIIKHAKAHNQILFLLEKARMEFAKQSLYTLKPVKQYLMLWFMHHMMTMDKEIFSTEPVFQVKSSAVLS